MPDNRGVQPLDFDFLKNRYDLELQRKDKLTDALNLPVGVLGVFGSVLAVMVRSFAFHRNVITVVFVVFLVLSVASFFACLIQLGRAYHRQKYKYLPLLHELEEKLEEWRAFYLDAHHAGAEEDFFNHELRQHIIEAADRNTVNNDERSRLLYWARVWLFVLLGSTTAAGIPYLVSQVMK